MKDSMGNTISNVVKILEGVRWALVLLGGPLHGRCRCLTTAQSTEAFLFHG